MRVTSSIHKTDKEFSDKHGSSPFKSLAALVFTATLALAPLPTFAQHGGGGGGGAHGGGGGGSHGGGMSGGGSHASGSGSTAHGSSAPASHSAAGSGTSAAATGNHWWNPFHGSGTSSSAQPAGSNAAANPDHVAAERFAGNNNTWQEPPASGARGSVAGGATNTTKGIASTPRAAVASPPHIPVPRRPVGYLPYYPFFPYYGGYGYGYGGFGLNAFGPCDPFWGCYGYGYGYGYGGGGVGYGYYGGSFSSDNGYGADLNYSGGQDTTPSQEPNPSLYVQAPETLQEQQTATAGPAEKHVVAVLYLKTGSNYAVTDYWLADGKVHYVTSYGGENAIDESDLDLQKTVDENAAQGLMFTLRPGPVVSGGAIVVPQ